MNRPEQQQAIHDQRRRELLQEDADNRPLTACEWVGLLTLLSLCAGVAVWLMWLVYSWIFG